METIDFVRCPKCQSQFWSDIPDSGQKGKYKWKCHRCNYLVVISKCAKCKSSDWKMVKGVDPKGGHRPYFRYECQTCKRIIGILLYSDN